MCVCTCVFLCVCLYALCVCTCVCACECACVCVHMCVHVCVDSKYKGGLSVWIVGGVEVGIGDYILCIAIQQLE